MNEKLLLLFSLISLTVCDKFRFDNYSLFKILPKTEKDVVLIQALQNNDISLDFWNDPIPGAEYVNIMTTPAKRSSLEAFLNLYGIDFEVTIENIQEAIDKESVSSYTRNSRSMRWDTYYKMADIDAWMNDMAAAYPDIASSIVGGATYEGRQIRGLKISHGTGRKIIFIESGIHAREWIAPATACYIINELLTSDDEQTRAAVEEYDWYIFPVTNPDGYVWTHEEERNYVGGLSIGKIPDSCSVTPLKVTSFIGLSKQDAKTILASYNSVIKYRLWRKNRRPVGTEFGIDLNRNWNSNWLVEGVSTNPQSNTYAGTGPFSEVETRTLSTYIQSISSDITLYISFHSSGQLLLIPYGNTTDPLDNYYDALVADLNHWIQHQILNPAQPKKALDPAGLLDCGSNIAIPNQNNS